MKTLLLLLLGFSAYAQDSNGIAYKPILYKPLPGALPTNTVPAITNTAPARSPYGTTATLQPDGTYSYSSRSPYVQQSGGGNTRYGTWYFNVHNSSVAGR